MADRFRIAQSWEKLDGLSLRNPGKPQMIAQSWETPDALGLHNPGKH